MSDAKVWFVTGAARGMGNSFVRAALAQGHAVVATGRRPDELTQAFGQRDDLLAVRLDVTSVDDADSAVKAAVERFGRVDVVVNNAGASFKGFFEEMSPRQVEQQLATNLLGSMNVTRSVLPVMRRQRSGHLIAISSGAGLVGFEYSSVYAASKFGLEGWMGALAQEIAPFGIHTTVVNPGFFRTGLASPESLIWPELAIDDYAERSATQREWWQAQDGHQAGDPDKLAMALMTIAAEQPPPRRFIAGADVLELAERRIAELQAQLAAHRELSSSLDVDD
ncbi:MAG: SDR family NAD(P)-dependent oxidoreductase [Actinomycetota bacterium]|nr:SDR family NAD(P)-dependent oxidoreductase [Actinomycetota bacterium]